MLELLQESDSEAADLWTEKAKSLNFIPVEIRQKVKHFINDFNFDAAFNILTVHTKDILEK